MAEYNPVLASEIIEVAQARETQAVAVGALLTASYLKNSMLATAGLIFAMAGSRFLAVAADPHRAIELMETVLPLLMGFYNDVKEKLAEQEAAASEPVTISPTESNRRFDA